MKQQKYPQTAFDKASFNSFGNRQRGGQARTSGNNKRGRWATGVFLCVSLLLTLFCWTGGQAVKADTSIGNVAAGSGPIAVAVNPVTNKIYVANSNSFNVTVIDGTNNSTTRFQPDNRRHQRLRVSGCAADANSDANPNANSNADTYTYTNTDAGW